LKASACKTDKNLLDAFIKLLAGAIDAKAPTPEGIASEYRPWH
jgi:hypothetical protein